MIKTILFDLDGTLLPMDNDLFTKYYFGFLCKKLAPYGYEQQELIDAIWTGTAAMVKNDGTKRNEEVFWDKFEEILGSRVRDIRDVIDDFYNHEFLNAKAVCGYNQKLVDLVHELKGMGYTVALATNPIFPAVATRNRIGWAGFTPEDFALVTTYENIGVSKPNPAYYTEILSRLGAKAEETVMIGNDAEEDMIAETLGMKVFLLTDFLLNKKNRDITPYPQGDADALREFLLSCRD